MEDITEDFNLKLLQLLARELPITRTLINNAFRENRFTDLHNLLHKLQGTCVYCELPKLKAAIIKLDSAIKKTNLVDRKLLDDVNDEVDRVISDLKQRKIMISNK